MPGLSIFRRCIRTKNKQTMSNAARRVTAVANKLHRQHRAKNTNKPLSKCAAMMARKKNEVHGAFRGKKKSKKKNKKVQGNGFAKPTMKSKVNDINHLVRRKK